MKLIGELYHPDVALLPIGGRFTMGMAEAMMAANFVGAKTVIPIHYNTWDKIGADPLLFKKTIERTTDIHVSVLRPGECLEIRNNGCKNPYFNKLRITFYRRDRCLVPPDRPCALRWCCITFSGIIAPEGNAQRRADGLSYA